MKFCYAILICIFCINTSYICNETDNSSSFYLISKMATNVQVENAVKVYQYSIDTASFYYFQDFTIFRFPSIVDFETNLHLPNSGTYFIQKGSDQLGYFLNKVDDTIGQHVNIDTVLNYYGYKTNNLSYYDFVTEWKFIEKIIIDENSFVEKYIPFSNNNLLAPDTILMTFSNSFKACQYSLSKSIDSIKGLKLIGSKMIFNKRSFKDQGDFPSKVVCVNIEKNNLMLPKEILNFINHKYMNKLQ